MAYDPIVDEIHKYREELARRFNNDTRAIVRYFQEQQKKSGRKVVDLSSPRKKKPATQDKNE